MMPALILAALASVGVARPITDLGTMPLNLTQFVGQNVLFVVAHPDDIEGLAGGLAYQLSILPGTTLYYLIATNGDKGGSCYNDTTPTEFYNCSKEALAVLRRQEALNAAHYFGVAAANVRFLDLEDSMLNSVPQAQVRLKMAAFMRRVKPFAVFSFNPELNLRAPPLRSQLPNGWDDLGYHPDHQACGGLVRDTLLSFEVSSPLMFDELLDAGLAPWTVSQYYMFALTAPEMTHYVDISGTPMQKKLNAFMFHRSQTEDQTAYIQANGQWVAAQIAINADAADLTLAEGYTAYF